MFANDKNLYFSHKNIRELFHTVNSDTNKVFEWFNVNKLFLNKDNPKITLFHKVREKDNIPLKLPSLVISDKEITGISDIFKGYRYATPDCNGLNYGNIAWGNTTWTKLPLIGVV